MQQAVPYRWHWLWWRRDAQWGHSGRRPAAVSLWTTSCHGSRFWLTQPYTRGTWDLSRQKGNTSVVSLWNNGSHQLQLPAMIANSLPLRKTLNWTQGLASWLAAHKFHSPSLYTTLMLSWLECSGMLGSSYCYSGQLTLIKLQLMTTTILTIHN